jgi:hypothetical protein
MKLSSGIKLDRLHLMSSSRRISARAAAIVLYRGLTVDSVSTEFKSMCLSLKGS